jgi:hypothetical protein
MTQTKSDDVLKELEFELEEGSGPRFLLAVCDDDDRAKVIREAVDKRLELVGKDSVNLSSAAITGNVVDAILAHSTTGNPAAVHLVQAKNFSQDQADRFFRELNFQRDSISKLSVPVILWVNSQQLPKLASRAPDLWSRRTSTLYFDVSSIGALLERIFGVDETAANNQTDEIATALREILDAERGLNSCLSVQRNFSLRNADGFIQKLKVNAGKLLQECSNGRKLDVALWLWNASQMDLIVERGMRSRHGLDLSAYLDRNDLLLALARQAERLLTQYLSQIDRVVRSKEKISLLDMVTSSSKKLWSNMVSAATHEAGRTQSIEYAAIEHYEPGVPSGPQKSSGGSAAMEFELWLVGAVEKKPKIFTDEEAELLKYLYSKEGNPMAQAPLSAHKIQKMMPLLKEKVRLFLEDFPAF